VPFDVDRAGRYEVVAEVAHSPDYGNYTVLLDGKPVSDNGALEHEPGANTGTGPSINAYFTETYVAEDHLLGWLTLTPGRHVVTFACAGKHPDSTGHFLGIDTIVLARIEPLAESDAARRARALRAVGERRRAEPGDAAKLTAGLQDGADEVREAAAWAIGQLGGQDSTLVRGAATALDDKDPVVRGLAALALRDGGAGAVTALDALVAHLGDEDVNVRMMSAQAIGSQGPDAARAVGPLVDACRRPDEHVHVLRSLADALGAIGPAARDGLPALRDLARIPRVRWSAEAAITRVEGKK
jgi:HEAT repeat protein